MEVSIAELLDRLSICRLKVERIGEPHLKFEVEELEKAIEEYKEEGIKIKSEWLTELYKINGVTWDLESDIRKGKEGILGLEEVGCRAILIRENNKKRISVKNRIIDETKIGFKDVKMNHISEEKHD